MVGGNQVTIGVPIELDGRVLVFALALALLSAVIVGIAPVWLSNRGAVFDTLRRGGRHTTDRSQPRLRQGLVVAEMAPALMLLAGGGLFLRGLQRFTHADPGWQTEGLLTGRIHLPATRYPGPAARHAAVQRLQLGLANLPGVESAALAGWLPVTSRGKRREFRVEGELAPVPGLAPSQFDNDVSPEYFATLGIPLREGRLLGRADRLESLPVVVVNETMARQLWPGTSALGKRIAWLDQDPSSPRYWKTVVGVVGDVQYRSSFEDPKSRYQAYYPLAQTSARAFRVAVRTRGDPQALVPGLRQAVAEVDPELLVYEPLSAQALAERFSSNFFLAGWIMFALAGLGIALSGLGVYGLFSGFVVERTREIGVRMALGAQRGEVIGLILTRGLRVAGLGAGLGAIGALAVVPVLRAIAFELPAPEPAAVVLLPLLMVAVALFACWLPARRAASVDPMIALRQD